MKRILYNALIINEGEKYKGYIEIEDDLIRNTGKGEVPSETLDLYASGERENLEGKWILPGIIDDQVHFREPGLTHKADIESESKAAALGGITSFMDMPNTSPRTVTIPDWEDKMRRGKEKSSVNYSFFIGATNDNIDEIKRIDNRLVPGIKVFLGASTGNMLVDSEETLDKIFSLPHIIAVHSEEESIINANKKRFIEKFRTEDLPVELHPLIRSREACVVSTEKAMARAKRLGTNLHVFHISTAEESLMFEPYHYSSETNPQITAEVCVHHLYFTDESYPTLGTKIKWNPAVKSKADREALLNALNEGRIAVIATDHAPHLPEEKKGGALKAASGGPLIQFSLPVMIELVQKEEVTDMTKVVDCMCHNPATLYKIRNRGFIRKGYYADLCVVDPNRPFTVSKEIIASKCGWSPFEGHTFPASVEETFVNGRKVVSEGKLTGEKSARALEFQL